MNKFAIAVILGLGGTACIGPSPKDLSTTEPYLVVVNSVRLPDYMDWYTRFAQHSWIDIKDGDDESWIRLEVQGRHSGIEMGSISAADAMDPMRWDNRVSVLETLSGDAAREAIPTLIGLGEAELDFGRTIRTHLSETSWSSEFVGPEDRQYEAWPGPNSNTFVIALVDGTPGLHAELHHNAVGKDYPRGFRAGTTASGFGLEADVGYLGAGIGLRQGVELHLGGLTAGIGLWPPALKIPFLPRIGVHQGWVGAAGGLE